MKENGKFFLPTIEEGVKKNGIDSCFFTIHGFEFRGQSGFEIDWIRRMRFCSVDLSVR